MNRLPEAPRFHSWNDEHESLYHQALRQIAELERAAADAARRPDDNLALSRFLSLAEPVARALGLPLAIVADDELRLARTTVRP